MMIRARGCNARTLLGALTIDCPMPRSNPIRPLFTPATQLTISTAHWRGQTSSSTHTYPPGLHALIGLPFAPAISRQTGVRGDCNHDIQW